MPRRVARFTAVRTLDDYLADEMLRAAVERQFEIIGAALNSLRHAHPLLAAQIADLSRIIAFRNVLIHDYAGVDSRLVWGIVQRELPLLLGTLSRMLANDDPEP